MYLEDFMGSIKKIRDVPQPTIARLRARNMYNLYIYLRSHRRLTVVACTHWISQGL
jgi:hypothetical protein